MKGLVKKLLLAGAIVLLTSTAAYGKDHGYNIDESRRKQLMILHLMSERNHKIVYNQCREAVLALNYQGKVTRKAAKEYEFPRGFLERVDKVWRKNGMIIDGAEINKFEEITGKNIRKDHPQKYLFEGKELSTCGPN